MASLLTFPLNFAVADSGLYGFVRPSVRRPVVPRVGQIPPLPPVRDDIVTAYFLDIHRLANCNYDIHYLSPRVSVPSSWVFFNQRGFVSWNSVVAFGSYQRGNDK